MLFNSGRYLELESRTRLLVKQYPNSGFAWNVLGVSLQALGKDALPALRKATELLPNDAGAHSNLGNALRDLGQLDDAMASYRRALEIKPDLIETQSSLLFIHNYLSDLPVATLLAEARRFGDLVAKKSGACQKPT
ncbi:MAG: tetratricopeptide repeat protein [Pseudomonadota bacterium]